MSAKETLLKILNLDGVVDGSQAPKQRRSKAGEPAQAEPTEPAGSPWEAAGRARAQATSPVEETPWQTERPDAGRKWYWKLLRGVLVAALLLVVLVGLRTMFFPASPVTADAAPKATPFPAADARGVAERFAESYLTWNADNPQSRHDALSIDMAGLGADDLAGWDGSGRQEGSSARTLDVDAADSTHAVATVVVKVRTWVEDGEQTRTNWTGLAVPLEVVDGRVVVTALPATVGVPEPSKGEATQAPSDDSALTEETEEYAATFFAAYGAEADVDALTAPEAGIAGLNGLYELDAVTSWTVYAGKGNTREARAVVSWLTSAGTILEQPYSLDLIEVTAGSTSRWQIESLTGASR